MSWWVQSPCHDGRECYTTVNQPINLSTYQSRDIFSVPNQSTNQLTATPKWVSSSVMKLFRVFIVFCTFRGISLVHSCMKWVKVGLECESSPVSLHGRQYSFSLNVQYVAQYRSINQPINRSENGPVDQSINWLDFESIYLLISRGLLDSWVFCTVLGNEKSNGTVRWGRGCGAGGYLSAGTTY